MKESERGKGENTVGTVKSGQQSTIAITTITGRMRREERAQQNESLKTLAKSIDLPHECPVLQSQK